MRRIAHKHCVRTLLARRLSSRARSHAASMSWRERLLNLASPAVAMTLHSQFSLLDLLQSNTRTCYGRDPLPWAAGSLVRLLRARFYSLGLVWRRGGQPVSPADGGQSGRRDQPLSGLARRPGTAMRLQCLRSRQQQTVALSAWGQCFGRGEQW